MDFAFPENLARRETGRRPISLRERSHRRLIVYPSSLKFQPFLMAREKGSASESYFLDYSSNKASAAIPAGVYWSFILRLLSLLPLCSRVDLYLFSDRGGWFYTLMTIIAARLLGSAVDLHDYRFKSEQGRRLTRLIHPLCRHLEIGDISAIDEEAVASSSAAFRVELPDTAWYRKISKNRAVPRVLVYGDFEDRKVVSLTWRTHDLIKQKYPRTEFVMMSFTSEIENSIAPEMLDSSVHLVTVASENDLRVRFEEADTVLLLSRGGLNRCFLVRGRAAGYPVIANGFDYPGTGVITVPRDSYSGLADTVIRLVDDDAYFQSFSAK